MRFIKELAEIERGAWCDCKISCDGTCGGPPRWRTTPSRRWQRGKRRAGRAPTSPGRWCRATSRRKTRSTRRWHASSAWATTTPSPLRCPSMSPCAAAAAVDWRSGSASRTGMASGAVTLAEGNCAAATALPAKFTKIYFTSFNFN